MARALAVLMVAAFGVSAVSGALLRPAAMFGLALLT
jgi:hypothetical protein